LPGVSIGLVVFYTKALIPICESLRSLNLEKTFVVGIVKERMDAMKDMGKQSKLVAKMFKGKAEFNKSELIKTADVFVTHGLKMDEQFPDTEMSRTGSKTEALPLIWEERADFTERTERFLQDSEELVPQKIFWETASRNSRL